MAIPSFIQAISELQNPASLSTQVAALKHLKTDLVGHTERKVAAVKHGVVNALVGILTESAKSRGKRRTQELNGSGHGRNTSLAEEEDVRLEAVQLLCSLALDGPSFATPIVAGSAVPALMSTISPSDNSPRIVTAALRTLLALANTSRYAHPHAEPFERSSAAEHLYSTASIQAFGEVLSQRSNSLAVQNQIYCVCEILKATCEAEYQRVSLLSGGVLDLLAARVAAHRYHSYPRPRIQSSFAAALPPVPSTKLLTSILGLLSAIVGHSKHRVARLFYSPTVLSVLPFCADPTSELVSRNRDFLGPLDMSLPRIHIQHHREVRFSEGFPPLGSIHSMGRGSGSVDLADAGQALSAEKGSLFSHSESSVIPWLFHLVRSEHGLCRVEAALLLTRIAQVGFLSQYRERMLSLFVVPILVAMIDEPLATTKSLIPQGAPEDLLVRERAPIVLAELIDENATLQKPAFDANVIPKACKLLKDSFEPLESTPQPWTTEEASTQMSQDPPTSETLGFAGLRPDLVHSMRCRESALYLLAALASKEDKYRKAFTGERFVIQYMIDSLLPFQPDVLAAWDSTPGKQRLTLEALGGDVNILLAACKAAKNLSRSVNLLRTSLIDAGLAKPIFALLRNSNVPVLIAATDVVCNLIMEFSPMRSDLVEAGAIKVLCEHAHSADSKIRLGALWALKHLVNQSPNEVKIQCFEELGTGWLIQIISGGSSSHNGGGARKVSPMLAMGTANAAGERVDILNAMDEPMDTSDVAVAEPVKAPATDDAVPGDEAMVHLKQLLTPGESLDELFNQLGTTWRDALRSIKDAEDTNAALQAHRDEQAIQSQGLDFVRNLIQGTGAADMIDCLFQTLGATRIFDIIYSKLKAASFPGSTSTSTSTAKPLSSDSSQQDNNSSTSTTTLPPTPEVLQSAVFILVHIAAGTPRHRQQLISQPALLRSLLPLLSHPDVGIRVSSVWTLCNLTWVDDKRDEEAAVRRALELKALGFEDALRRMTGDESLDVRERVNTALEQVGKLIGDAGVGAGGSSAGVGAAGVGVGGGGEGAAGLGRTSSR